MTTLTADKVNILLVDDQPARLLSYETILGVLGHNLVTAHSGIAALEKLMGEDDFAVVLLDVSMPGMDGFETAAMIHDHPRYESTPIIFVTGVHDSDLDRLQGYKLGAVDYVSIPVVPEILRGKVSVLVELYLQRRALEDLNRSLEHANTELAKAHHTLQAEKNRELEALNSDLQQANAELARYNNALQAEIGERKRIEQVLTEADRQKDEFLAILAHELRNPLAPIRSAVEIMSRASFDNPQLSWTRDVIGRQVQHMSRLVDDLLDISRITRGTINLVREQVSVGAILNRAVEAVAPAIAEHRHQLVVNCDDETLTVEGDLTRLVQVVGNLLNNAARYTNDGGCITITTAALGEMLEIRVADTGVGIPAESIPRLFHLFSRLPTSMQRASGGLGIGLALARRIVLMHGGDVAVHSAGVDRGSEFIVRLPLRHSGSVRADDSRPAPGSTNLAALRILVADDNQDALETLAILLELEGHTVVRAYDGEQALRLGMEHAPELVLLDIGMPGLDGYEVARQLRRASWSHEVLFVALSGWGQPDDVQRAHDAGFDHHFVKPVPFERVAQIVEAAASRRRQQVRSA